MSLTGMESVQHRQSPSVPMIGRLNEDFVARFGDIDR